MYNLQVENELFLSAEGGVKSLDKSDSIEKNYNKKSIFCKTFSLSFHLSAFEVTFIKTSNCYLKQTFCFEKKNFF